MKNRKVILISTAILAFSQLAFPVFSTIASAQSLEIEPPPIQGVAEGVRTRSSVTATAYVKSIAVRQIDGLVYFALSVQASTIPSCVTYGNGYFYAIKNPKLPIGRMQFDQLSAELASGTTKVTIFGSGTCVSGIEYADMVVIDK